MRSNAITRKAHEAARYFLLQVSENSYISCVFSEDKHLMYEPSNVWDKIDSNISQPILSNKLTIMR